MQRGDVYRFKVPKGIGHEQQGERFGVVVQSDALLPRSVVVVAPTSRSARPASFRPEIPGPLNQLLLALLARDPDRRPNELARPHDGGSPSIRGMKSPIPPP